MTISASIVADSINETDNRLVTYLLRYGRQDHAELMTHRAFSRNSGSSRAVPFNVTVRRVLDEPFVPEFWGVRSAGMQAPEDVSPEVRAQAERIWANALQDATMHAQALYDLGLHKLRPNRLLEPWTHIEVVVSATEWKNWFLLREDKGAEYHIRKLAGLMHDLQREHQPNFRKPHGFDPCAARDPVPSTLHVDWHLPFVDQTLSFDHTEEATRRQIRESVAHCAWVSYGNVEGKPGFTQEDCDATYGRLVQPGCKICTHYKEDHPCIDAVCQCRGYEPGPIHASPTEHPAVACSGPHRHGNLVGFCAWRQFLPNESGGDYLAT